MSTTGRSAPRLQVLGPLRGCVDGVAIGLGGPRQRVVLAMLLCARPAAVSLDRLIDGVWGAKPPPSATTTVRAYVSRLRRALGPDRPRDEPAALLATSAAGYALKLPDDAVDAWRFERMVREARRLGRAEPVRARKIVSGALSLWRGPAYPEIAELPWAAGESARLEELRLTAWELLIELTLRSGTPSDAVPVARALTHQHPLREEGWRLLAVCLWASSRQVEALAALRRSRAVLIDEAGVDPGPALVELERAILAQRVDVLEQWAGRHPAVAGNAGLIAARVPVSWRRSRRRPTTGVSALRRLVERREGATCDR
jgi:DNA-binding SARP family transcriptional activator